MHYYAELGQCSVFSATEAPEQFINQVTVLKYFSHYMEENLMDVSSATFRVLSCKKTQNVNGVLNIVCSLS